MQNSDDFEYEHLLGQPDVIYNKFAHLLKRPRRSETIFKEETGAKSKDYRRLKDMKIRYEVRALAEKNQYFKDLEQLKVIHFLRKLIALFEIEGLKALCYKDDTLFRDIILGIYTDIHAFLKDVQKIPDNIKISINIIQINQITSFRTIIYNSASLFKKMNVHFEQMKLNTFLGPEDESRHDIIYTVGTDLIKKKLGSFTEQYGLRKRKRSRKFGLSTRHRSESGSAIYDVYESTIGPNHMLLDSSAFQWNSDPESRAEMA